jgi:starch phosphorylase
MPPEELSGVIPDRHPLWSFTRDKRVAYFSMEVALRPEIHTYGGGLGMLAGDTVRSAADLDLPLVAVTLLSRNGYFRQILSASGEQQEEPDEWRPADYAQPLDAKVAITLEGRAVWLSGWLYVEESAHGPAIPVILLDTDLPENTDADRQLTDRLYGGDRVYRLKQEMLLGLGGARLLRGLGFQVSHFHMNEGHAAFLVLELLRETALPGRTVHAGESIYDLPRVRDLCIFTTHTPVEAGHDRFDYELFERVAGYPVDRLLLRQLAGSDELNVTRLALSASQYVNGVAGRHAETSRHMFPGFAVRAVTNGVHGPTWAAASIAALYDRYLPAWRQEPETLLRAEASIPDEELWTAHLKAKEMLRAEVARYGVLLDPQQMIIGFARRMTAYKRPTLLFSDLERLRAIARRQPFQLVFAGKAHPQDAPGKSLIREIHENLRLLHPEIRSVFLPNYEMRVARLLVAGTDLWLNTPQPPLEASGTSGMKAAYNGVPSLSILDGWWLEGHIEGVTGWSIGNGLEREAGIDSSSLYVKLEQTVLPAYYRGPDSWSRIMKATIAHCASLFSSHQMMRRYAADAYLH